MQIADGAFRLIIFNDKYFNVSMQTTVDTFGLK